MQRLSLTSILYTLFPGLARMTCPATSRDQKSRDDNKGLLVYNKRTKPLSTTAQSKDKSMRSVDDTRQAAIFPALKWRRGVGGWRRGGLNFKIKMFD